MLELPSSTAAEEAALGTLTAGEDSLSPACGGGGARARHAAGRRRRWLVPDTAGETPEQGRRAAVTAISAMARNGAEEGRGGDPNPKKKKRKQLLVGSQLHGGGGDGGGATKAKAKARTGS